MQPESQNQEKDREVNVPIQEGGYPQLIVAADKMSSKEFYRLLYAMEEFLPNPYFWGVKMNDVLVNIGAKAIRIVNSSFGFGAMADLKCSDIDSTNRSLIEVMLQAGASIITVQTTAGYKADPLGQGRSLAGITVLTSVSDQTCQDLYGKSRHKMVFQLTGAAFLNGYRYVVCGATDLAVAEIRSAMRAGGLIPICPGIRPVWSLVENDNQVTKATPSMAVQLGAGRLVVGRPIIQLRRIQDIKDAIKRTLEEIQQAWLDGLRLD